MARYVLLEASPWRLSDGVAEAVHLAGGGVLPYSGLRGFTDWRSGVADFPMFLAAAGYGEKGWTGGAIPQTSQIRIFPSDDALRATLLSKYNWKGAPIEIRSGDDSIANTYILELTGVVDSVSFTGGAVLLTVADLSSKLNAPVVSDKFAGTGGIEGPTEAEGKAKRRSWGFVRNVEGFLLDKPNNIFEFGDPSRPLNSIVTVRDMGRDASPTPTTVAWQGSIAATLTALQASSPAQGSCVNAPSIACVKWWTTPVGPLTADIQGEIGAGYVNKIADIANRLAAVSASTFGTELVGDPGFDSAPYWSVTGGWSITGSKASGSAANGYVFKTGTAVTSGKTYQWSFTISTRSAGSVRAYVGSTAVFGASQNAVGSYSGQFTATSSGELGLNSNDGFTGTVDNLSIREVIAGVAVAPADVTAINTARPAISGIHIGDTNESVSQALDRLLIPSNVIWGLNPDGTIRLSQTQLSTPIAEIVTADSVERIETYKPIWQAKVGYKKNYRKHSSGEISAALQLANVTGPTASTTFSYDYLGAADSGQLPRNLDYKLLWGDGTALSSGVTWQYRVLTGTVNTFTSSSSWHSLSGTGAGTVAISSLGTDSSTIEVKATYGGDSRSATTTLTKKYSAAPTGGGGGGGGGATTLASKSSGFTSINSTTFTDITGTIVAAAMPTGVTTANLSANITFQPTGTTSGSWTIELKWQRLISAVWTDQGGTPVVSGDSDATHDIEFNTTDYNAATILNNQTITGLTAGTAYSWRLVARLTSGTRSHTVTGTLSVTA